MKPNTAQVKAIAETIRQYLIYFGLSDTIARFAAAQAAHETGGFSSSVYITNKNAFGMTYVGQGTALGKIGNYAYYADLKQSCQDFAKWYIKHRSNVLSLPLFISGVPSYVSFLKNNNYFEDSIENYTKGVTYYNTLIYS